MRLVQQFGMIFGDELVSQPIIQQSTYLSTILALLSFLFFSHNCFITKVVIVQFLAHENHYGSSYFCISVEYTNQHFVMSFPNY